MHHFKKKKKKKANIHVHIKNEESLRLSSIKEILAIQSVLLIRYYAVKRVTVLMYTKNLQSGLGDVSSFFKISYENYLFGQEIKIK